MLIFLTTIYNSKTGRNSLISDLFIFVVIWKFYLVMEINSCRICLASDVCRLSSLFSHLNTRTYAELVSYSCGIDVIIWYSSNIFHKLFTSSKSRTNRKPIWILLICKLSKVQLSSFCNILRLIQLKNVFL